MSSRTRGLRALSGPVLLGILSASTFTACGDGSENALECESKISAKADAFSTSVDALVTASADMKASLYVACARIASDLGEDADPAATNVTDEQLTDTCDLAVTAIAAAKASVSGGIELIYVPPRCEVAASAQLSCEASCDVDAMCQPGSIEARCTAAELSGKCEGTCTGEVRCEGSASVAAECEGRCDAECTGTCEGTCKGECDGTCSAMGTSGECEGTCDGTCTGSCSATCTGTCKGTCTLEANAMVECEAQATCKGGCSVEYEAPKCEAELMEPSCKMNAECEAGCKGQAQFKATCTEPEVSVVAMGNAELTATLEANLPAIFEVKARAELVANAAVDVASSAVKVAGEVAGSVQCVASYGADFAAKMQASAEASVSVSVSVSASASVSSEASS
jgi:hypothetical protein